jgi:hypothetical protein
MEPQENKQLAVRKAISAHENAVAALSDLINDCDDAKYAAMLELVNQNLNQLHADTSDGDPAETV